MIKQITRLIAFLIITGSQANAAENIKVFQCYDDMLMTTKITNAYSPHGSVKTTPRWEIQNALVFVDLSKSTLLLWQTSKTINEILANQEKAHWTYRDILASDDLISAHRRSTSAQFNDEFEIITIDLKRPKLIKTVSMNNDEYRWTKHYDCRQTHG
jgi:hypothetical protein|tara:strand:- start:61 stop:531 length:471 start_codon:yes stop_codon:yes gene_type:complete